MSRTATLTLDKATENAYKMKEKATPGKAPIMQQGMYLPKWMFKSQPDTVTITIEGSEVLPN